MLANAFSLFEKVDRFSHFVTKKQMTQISELSGRGFLEPNILELLSLFHTSDLWLSKTMDKKSNLENEIDFKTSNCALFIQK